MQFGSCAFRLAFSTVMLLDVVASSSGAEDVDVATIERIRAEGSQHSQVMEIASWLTDVYGSRLTGSPNLTAAADWAVTTMRSWDLDNVHLEPWETPENATADQ